MKLNSLTNLMFFAAAEPKALAAGSRESDSNINLTPLKPDIFSG